MRRFRGLIIIQCIILKHIIGQAEYLSHWCVAHCDCQYNSKTHGTSDIAINGFSVESIYPLEPASTNFTATRFIDIPCLLDLMLSEYAALSSQSNTPSTSTEHRSDTTSSAHWWLRLGGHDNWHSSEEPGHVALAGPALARIAKAGFLHYAYGKICKLYTLLRSVYAFQRQF